MFTSFKLDNPLLTEIALLPLQEFKHQIPREYFQRGRDYHAQARLKSLRWHDAAGPLEAKIQGSVLYHVYLSLTSRERLAMSCSCPAWNDYTQCKHVVCALLTIRELIAASDAEGNSPANSQSPLAKQLFDKSSSLDQDQGKQKILEIQLSPQNTDFFFLQFSLSGKPLALTSGRIPYEFRSQNSGFYQNRCLIHESRLLHFLRKFNSPYQLLIHTKEGLKKAVWAPQKFIQAGLTLNLTEKFVQILRTASQGQGTLEKFMRISECLYFDPEKEILGKIKNRQLWNWADSIEEKISRAANPGSLVSPWDPEFLFNGIELESQDLQNPVYTLSSVPLEVPHHVFNKFSPLTKLQELEQWLPFVSLKKENQSTEITSVEAGLKIDFHNSAPPGYMEIEIQGKVAEAVSPLDATLLNPFFLLQYYFSSSKKKQHITCMMIFERLLACESKNLKTSLFEEIPAPEDVDDEDESDIKRVMEEVSECMKAAPSQQLIATREGWKRMSWNTGKIFRLIGILYLVLGKRLLHLFKNKSFPLIPVQEIYTRLGEIHALLSAEKVDLYFERKKTVPISLDFKIEAVESGEDWFELHPEIRAFGEILSDKEWHRILYGGERFLERNGLVQIFDHNITNLLGSVARLLNPKAAKKSSGQQTFVRIPRLQILDWLAFKRAGVQLKLPAQFQALLEKLLNFQAMPSKNLPAGFCGKLRDYQVKGYEWLSFHYEHHFGACLADDMGLGKTIQAIAFLGGLKEGLVNSRAGNGRYPHLIVVPPTLLFNWQSEIEKFYPDLQVRVYSGLARHFPEDGDIILTSYDTVRRDIARLEKERFHVIIFDEAQMIKNLVSQRTSAVRRLRAIFKICLTGTPFENHLGEYYSVLDLCVPGILGDFPDFKERLKDQAMIETLIHRTRPFVLRRSKEKILTELPTRIESDVYLDLSTKQKALYVKMIREVRPAIEEAYLRKTEAQARIIALTALLRLRQICVSPKLLDPAVKERSPKIEQLLIKLEELREEGHACIVFSQFTKFLDILEKELSSEGLGYCRMDGRTPVKKRKEIVSGFQDRSLPGIFLLSLKTGGVGLNLTRASYVFHLDPWWNPAVDRQASDRVHRIGQTRNVIIQRLLMRQSIEEKVMSLREKKQALFQKIMDEGIHKDSAVPITRSDIEFLLS